MSLSNQVERIRNLIKNERDQTKDFKETVDKILNNLKIETEAGTNLNDKLNLILKHSERKDKIFLEDIEKQIEVIIYNYGPPAVNVKTLQERLDFLLEESKVIRKELENYNMFFK